MASVSDVANISNGPGLPAFGPALDAVDDCWNRIGVQGDKRCELLPTHVHCRNCPVYARTAKTLLDRFPPTLAVVVAEPADDVRHAADDIALLVFRIEREWLGLPTQVLDEVAPVRPVHRLPHHWNPAMLGMTNVRGTLTVCLSLARMLGLEGQGAAEASERPGEPRMLVMGGKGRGVVFPVDEIDGIHRLSPASIDTLPATLAHSTTKYARGLATCGTRSVGVLDDIALVRAIERGLA